MDIPDKNKPALAKSLLYLSIAAVILATIGAFGTDVFWASTQWLLVGIMLGVWSLYLLLEAGLKIRK